MRLLRIVTFPLNSQSHILIEIWQLRNICFNFMLLFGIRGISGEIWYTQVH